MRHGRLLTAACALILFAANLCICRELFVTEYTVHLGSIEAAYISLARYLLDNWRDLTWFPLWYGGVPYQNTYPPLLHLLVAALAALLRISPALAHHAAGAFFYCLGSVTLFWMAWRISGRRSASFAAAMIWSLVSPAGFLIYGVRKDMHGLLHARRLQTLVEYGEAPHVASMALLPLAVLAWRWALRRGGLWRAYVTAALLASVVLTNFIGGAALLFAVLSCLLSGLSERPRAWLHSAALGALAYLLAGPWIPPTTLLAIRTNSQKIGGDFTMRPRHIFYAAAVALAAWALRRLLLRLPVSPFLRFALLFTFFTASITLAAEWRGVYLIPQPHRYHLEMEMALSLALAFGAAEVLSRGAVFRPRRASARLALVLPLALVPAACAASQFRTYRRYAREIIRPIHMASTLEYQLARWFDRHMHGRRVMAQGSLSFWLNAFTDTPQLGGGFDQGIVNDLNRHVVYGLYANETAERGGEIGVLWLKAYGVHAITVGGPGSREFHRPIRDPDKFRGLLPELWREGDDAVFGVPQRTGSLARVVPVGALPVRKPVNALDADPIRPYVAALEDPSLPEASFRWISRHEAAIEADVPAGHVLSVQISYHPGWRATINGSEAPVRKDNLGQIWIQPGFDGPLHINLVWDGGIEMRLLRWLRWCALLWLGISGVDAAWARRFAAPADLQ